MITGPFYYETNLSWEGARRALSASGSLPPIRTSSPAELRGEAGHWTPDQLLTAALEASLMASFLAIAEQSGLSVVSYSSSALAKSEWLNEESQVQLSKIVVRCVIGLEDESQCGRSLSAMREAQEACLVANALETSMEVSVEATCSSITPKPRPVSGAESRRKLRTGRVK